MKRKHRKYALALVSLIFIVIGSRLYYGAESARAEPPAGNGIFDPLRQGASHRMKDLEEYHTRSLHSIEKIAGVDSTVIDLRSIDTTGLSDHYTFWQEVAVGGGQVRPPTVGDVNGNGLAELYGAVRHGSEESQSPAEIWELDSTGNFQKQFTFGDSVLLPYGLFNVRGDGTKQVLMIGSAGNVFVAGADLQGQLPTVIESDLNPPRSGQLQVNDPTFGDFDSDGQVDYLFTLDDVTTYIAEIDTASRQIDTIFTFQPPDLYTEGFAIGDFDQNGKTDIVEASVHGDVYVIECEGQKQYEHVWTGQVETYNAYMEMATHDIDGNGKPEFWVGGDATYNGVAITRFTCFESNGVHSYVPVHRIDLVGVFSFYADNCFARDIDGDGKEELCICIDQHVIILKFDGQPGKQHYQIFYLKQNELADQNSVYYGATLFNVDGKGGDDLLISMDQAGTDYALRIFTRIYRPNFVASVPRVEANVPKEFILRQNYPNPFNPGTSIRFTIPSGLQGRTVSLRVFDLLGKEVRTLANERMSAGDHVVQWAGTDDNGRGVASGIYLIRLQCENYQQTIKSVLTK